MDSYTRDGKNFAFSYKELKAQYEAYELLTDEQFMADLPNILHFVVFVCWFKQLRAKDVLADDGLVHELVHLICLDGYDAGSTIATTRRLFTDTVRLA